MNNSYFEMNKEKNNLYSREICSFGMTTMLKLSKMKILIYGMRGLGLEIAKNLVISGPSELTIYDSNKVEISDLGSNFYLTEKNIGSRRDESVINKLRELNSYVKVNILDKEKENKDIFLKSLINYNVIAITEILEQQYIEEINEICRINKIGFIYCGLLGLSGFIFSDFGKEHIIYDKNGKKEKIFYIKNIENSKKGQVTIDDSLEQFSLNENDSFIFKNVKGMEELNNGITYKIKEKKFNSFCLGDTTSYHKYIGGGIIKEVKIPLKMNYKSLKERFIKPFDNYENINSFNLDKIGRNEFLFVIILSLHEFFTEYKNLPHINNNNDSKVLIDLTYKNFIKYKELYPNIFEEIESFNEKIIGYVSFWCRCQLSPLACFLGGIVSQEIIKYTGKYMPLNQWFFFDFFELVEILEEKETNIDRIIKNQSRYDEQISIFGHNIQKTISELNIFMPGTGAIGCEIIKNMALMGVSCSKNSKFIISDFDHIEVSNLSRQFLFKSKDIGKSKSKCACEAVKNINNNFNCENYNLKIGEESEDIFDDNFYINQNFLISAVDSNNARRYLDTKATKFDKILINTGTLGPVAKYDLIIPYKTICFNDIPESPQKEYGLCTLKLFPSKIEHCIQWTKNYFIEWFSDGLSQLKDLLIGNSNYIDEINNYDGSIMDFENKYSIIEKYIDLILSKNIDDYLYFSFNQFENLFNFSIKNLLEQYPSNHLDEQGNLFWKGTKTIPHPIQLNLEDNIIYDFIINMVKILLCSFSIEFNEDFFQIQNLSNVLKKYNKNTFAKKDYKDKENKKKLIEKINLFSSKMKKVTIKEIVFEIDNMEDYCKKFLVSCTKLRARNYNIEEINDNKILLIIGNIQPSLITSTASISGLACFQIYFLIQTKSIEYCRNGFLSLVNLDVNIYPPLKPKLIKSGNKDDVLDMEIKAIPNDFSIWNKLYINESMTCESFLNHFKEKYNVDINYISVEGIEIFYKSRGRKKKKEKSEQLNKKIQEIYFLK